MAALVWFDLTPPLESVLLFAVGWSLGWLLLWSGRPLPAPTADRSPVAVVIPARNEAASIEPLVRSLAAALRADDELLVVDDHSADDTASRARRAGARVVSAPVLPDGWLGKPHACWVGARASTAPVLVFVDADVTPGPMLVDRLAASLVGSESPEPGATVLVSVQPWHRTERVVESLSLPFNLMALMGSGAFTVLGERIAPQVAFGPVLACRRADYERGEGHSHASVRMAVAEDVALARRFDRVVLHTGQPAGPSFRMYPGSVRTLLDGWTKNVATGAASVRWWVLLASIGWLWSLAGGWLTSPWFAVASLVQLAVLGRRVGRFSPIAVLAYPLLVVVFLAVVARSAVVTLTGRTVPWKGRPVRARTRARGSSGAR